MIVQVRDNGIPRLNSVATLNITLVDTNDAPQKIIFKGGVVPEFTLERPRFIENGTVVGNLSTVDEDVGQHHTYEIVNNNDGLAAFRMNDSYLVVNCAFLLDYEAVKSWVIVVKATDCEGSSLTSYVTVRLLDVNERPFGITLSGYSILENAQIGTVVSSLSALDPDKHDNHTFTLSSNPGGFFYLEGHFIKTAFLVDYEITPILEITVTATDKGGLTFSRNVTITVQDQNEAPLTLALSKLFTNNNCLPHADACIVENKRRGYPVARITVNDPDRNDAVTCYVLSGEIFTVANMDLVVSDGVNYETMDPSHVITVMISCRDKGGLEIQDSFNISIIDGNDPIVNVHLSHRVVSSSASSDTLIGTFEIEDEDTSDSHYCVLLDPDSPFKIDQLQLKTRKSLIIPRFSITQFMSSAQTLQLFLFQRHLLSKSRT